MLTFLSRCRCLHRITLIRKPVIRFGDGYFNSKLGVKLPLTLRYPTRPLIKLIETMSSGRGRKRTAPGTGSVAGTATEGQEGGGDGRDEGFLGKRTARSRRTVKIEVEQDDGEEGTTSKYFPKDDPQPGVGSVGTGKGLDLDLQAQDKEVGKGSPGKKTKVIPVKLEPPKGWETILENIKTMRSSKTAAVDTMGCERTADLGEEPKVQRFQTLVSLMLSSQTKDQVTFAAMERLKERGLNVQEMLDVDETQLAEIIKPVGFYKRKATYIKKTSEILREKYEDDIPRTVEDLCSLPGVGPKMAYICMNAAWKESVGIGVDTHVHRIANRLRWTGKKGTATPEKTREALESWLPQEQWQELNILLVGFGQETCLPIGPKCGSCLNKDICPSSTVPKSKKKPGLVRVKAEIIPSGESRNRAATGTGGATATASLSDELGEDVTVKRATTSSSRRPPVKIEVEKDTDAIDDEGGAESQGDAGGEEGPPTAKKVGKLSSKKKAQVELEPPKNWETILENIRIMLGTTMDQTDDSTSTSDPSADLTEDDLKVKRFHILISLMLSSQTKDQTTNAAMERLKNKGLTIQSMMDVDETELGEIIKPVSFHKRKATYIKKTSGILREKYDDDIPRTVKDLCSLPGVGPKMANLAMYAAWNENVGIGVDTHIHRIANRLKWTGKNGTSTPDKTREALESWLPQELWQEADLLLVRFGQETCLAIGPKCESCLNKSICPSSTVPKSKKK